MRSEKLVAISLLGAALAVGGPALARHAAAAPPKPDLADVAQGIYVGDVISDSQGESHSDVTITVVKVAPGTVQVSSSYARLPSFNTRLNRAMQTIQQVGGSVVFLLDLAENPNGLDITDDGASWSGARKY